MIMALAAGAVAGAGLWAIARGVRPPVRLEDDLARLLGHAAPSGSPRWTGRSPLVVRGVLLQWPPLVRRFGLGRDLASDLMVTGRTAEGHATRCLVAAGCCVGLAVSAAAGLAWGGVRIPWMIAVGAAIAAVPAGIATVGLVTRAEATERREELRRTIATFLDLTTLSLAAGAGVESALRAAAGAGEGWTWEWLRAALRPAHVTGASPWEALERLGQDLDVVELVELSSAVALAVSSGGRLRETLAARAASLRSRELARAQAEAMAATERMTFPVVAMALGFLLLVGFPAVARVLGTY